LPGKTRTQPDEGVHNAAMADDDPDRVKGSSCTATDSALDERASATDSEAEPKQDGKVVKAVDGVLDFFSKWNG
jgi:hypothetical protein